MTMTIKVNDPIGYIIRKIEIDEFVGSYFYPSLFGSNKRLFLQFKGDIINENLVSKVQVVVGGVHQVIQKIWIYNGMLK